MSEQKHIWKLYDDGSGAFCIAHHEQACMMDRYDVERRLNANEEYHLENILRIMKHDDYEGVKIDWLNMYIASRRLIKNYYNPYGELLDKHVRIDIDNFLNSLPPFPEFDEGS